MDAGDIDGIQIQGIPTPEAKRALDALREAQLLTDQQIVLVDGDRCVRVIDSRADCERSVFVRKGNQLSFVGKLSHTHGDLIVRAAVEQLDRTASENAKLAAAERRRIAKSDKRALNQRLHAFDTHVPRVHKPEWERTMQRIDAVQKSFRAELYDEIDAALAGNYNAFRDMLPTLLDWFTKTVLDTEEAKPLDQRKTYFMLRKSFVSTIRRMAERGVVQSDGGMGEVKSGNEGFDWDSYARSKNEG